MNEDEIDNALVAQKDMLYGMLNEALKPSDKLAVHYLEFNQLETYVKVSGNVLDYLEFNKQLWAACRYNYKRQEIVISIRNQVDSYLTIEKLHYKTITKLQALRTRMIEMLYN